MNNSILLEHEEDMNKLLGISFAIIYFVFFFLLWKVSGIGIIRSSFMIVFAVISLIINLIRKSNYSYNVFVKIQSAVQETTSQIEETATSSDSLAQQSAEINDATDDIGNMSEDISDSSQELAELAQDLKLIVEDF